MHIPSLFTILFLTVKAVFTEHAGRGAPVLTINEGIVLKNGREIIELAKSLNIFKELDDASLQEVLTFFEAKTKEYPKGSIVKRLWDPIKEAGLILEGAVATKFLSDSGSEHRIGKIVKGDLFALSFACSKKASGESVEIVAEEDTEILYLELSKLFQARQTFSPAIHQVSVNLLGELAEKNVFLNKKVEILSRHRIRERVLVCLQSMSKGKKQFRIPLNREAMASFLAVERSALSRELSKMREEGLIDYEGNEFKLLMEE